MPRIPRRTLFGTAIAGGAALAGVPLVNAIAETGARNAPRWVGAGPFRHVYDPTPDSGPERYLNDHCVIQDGEGTWHLFSITGDTAADGEAPDSEMEDAILHATAPALDGPWTTQDDALTTDPDYHGENHLWAPDVLEHEGTYYLYYSAGGDDGWAINLATSTDLEEWTRIESGPLFMGYAARDTQIIRVGDEWVMYYCEVDNDQHIVAARTSTDLVEWSDMRAVFIDEVTEELGVSITESPYVVERDGWYYLFIGPRNGYVGTDVFASQDPFEFTLDGYAGHFPAHCAEIVRDGDDWRITAAGWFQGGLHVADLHWRDAPPLWHGPANPAAARDATGKLLLFALAEDRSTVLIRDLESDWEEFGSDIATVPTIATNEDGSLVAFALRPDGAAVMCVQNADGDWDSWQDFGGPFDAAPAVARNGDGHLEAFALAEAGAGLRHCRQTEPGGTEWSDWEEFGGAAGAPPVVAANADGLLEVFAVGPGGANLAHRAQDSDGDWGDWDGEFGTPTGTIPAAALGTGDRLQVMATGASGLGLHIRSQDPAGDWGSWQEWGGWAHGGAAMVANEDGRLEAFFVPPGGQVIWHGYQDSDGSWSDIAEFGDQRTTANPTACRDGDGIIHVFAVTPQGTVHTRSQLVPNGDFGDWKELDGAPIAPVPAGSAT